MFIGRKEELKELNKRFYGSKKNSALYMEEEELVNHI